MVVFNKNKIIVIKTTKIIKNKKIIMNYLEKNEIKSKEFKLIGLTLLFAWLLSLILTFITNHWWILPIIAYVGIFIYLYKKSSDFLSDYDKSNTFFVTCSFFLMWLFIVIFIFDKDYFQDTTETIKTDIKKLFYKLTGNKNLKINFFWPVKVKLSARETEG